MTQVRRCALVTGGAGFIGSHLVDRLLAEGWSVRVIDDLRLGNRQNLNPQADFIEADIRVSNSYGKSLSGVETVFHLAAESRNLPSLTGEASASFNVEVNTIGTIRVLEAAVTAGVKNVVYSASSTVYGDHAPPHHEDLLPRCLTPYGISKFSGEQFMQDASRRYRISTHSLRYFQVFGPRQPATGPYALVTGIFLRQNAMGQPLTIEGDGLQTRDFVSVFDVVEANYRCAILVGDGVPVNVGTGIETSVKELADAISDNQIYLPARAIDLRRTRADLTRCMQIFKWVPYRRILDELES